jgi:hypothetical protein
MTELYQHALSRAQVPLFEKRAAKHKLLTDVGNVKRQRGSYYRNQASVEARTCSLVPR